MRDIIFKPILYFSLFVVGFILLVVLKFALSSKFALDTSGLKGALGEETIDYLFIGSSHVRFSYDIEQIEKKTGIKGYAFSYAYFSYPFTYRVLQYLLDNQKKPIKKIIVDIYPLLFVKKDDFVDTRFFFDCPFDLKLKILYDILNSYHNLSCKHYYEILVSSENEAILTWPINNYLLADLSYKGGYQKKVLKGVSAQKFDQLTIDRADFDFSKVKQNELEGLLNIIKLLRQNNISLSFIETPLPKKVREMVEVRTIKDIVKKAINQNGHSYLDTAELPGLNNLGAEHFMDENHLSSLGRQLYSEMIAEMINKKTI